MNFFLFYQSTVLSSHTEDDHQMYCFCSICLCAFMYLSVCPKTEQLLI